MRNPYLLALFIIGALSALARARPLPGAGRCRCRPRRRQSLDRQPGPARGAGDRRLGRAHPRRRPHGGHQAARRPEDARHRPPAAARRAGLSRQPRPPARHRAAAEPGRAEGRGRRGGVRQAARASSTRSCRATAGCSAATGTTTAPSAASCRPPRCSTSTSRIARCSCAATTATWRWSTPRALKLAGITREDARSRRAASSIASPARKEPTGLLRDNAMGLVAGLIPPPSDEEIVEARAGRPGRGRTVGVTSVQDMDGSDAGDAPRPVSPAIRSSPGPAS